MLPVTPDAGISFNHVRTVSQPRSRRAIDGFTLIELLAVAGIIAILASIALARLGAAFDKARTAEAIADISNINKAIAQYRALNTGDLPIQMSDMVPTFYDTPPVDPWGTRYTYNNFTQITFGERRKDGPLVPINKEYDIFSAGPNGQTTPNIRSTQAKDDIIFANDGGFIDVAENY